MRRARVRLSLAAVLVLSCGAPHAACGDGLGRGTLLASSPGFDIAFRPDPSPIPVARHFTLDIVVCPKAAANLSTSLAVDAHMPAHRHGMNYRPSVTAVAPGRFRAEGLLFHMPGEWEFRFDVATERSRERAVLRKDVP